MIEFELCACESTRRVEEIGYWSGFPLEGNGHTSFGLGVCCQCGKITALPRSNLEIALAKGTEAGKARLAEIIRHWTASGHQLIKDRLASISALMQEAEKLCCEIGVETNREGDTVCALEASLIQSSLRQIDRHLARIASRLAAQEKTEGK